MKKSDRMILLVLPVLALVVGFYLLAISPKQKEIGELDDEIATLETRISDAEAQVATAEAARKAFPRNYAQIVSMGSAVPEDSDQATLIYDLTRAGDETDVHFRSFEISDDGAAAEAVAPPAATTTDTTTTDSTESGSSSDGSTASTTTDSTTTTSTVKISVFLMASQNSGSSSNRV